MKAQYFNSIKRIVLNLKNTNVLVVGDLILDEFLWGDVSRISPEAPVPVVWVKNESFMPGGAANVANNLRSLGANTYLVGIIGDDERGAILKGELEQKGINVDGLFIDETRPTTLKTRIVAQHQQVVRIDKEKIGPVNDKVAAKIVSYIKEKIKNIDAIIIEDYGKGVITQTLLRKVIPLARSYNKVVAVDPKEEHFRYYKGISLITPNNHEASKAVGFDIKDKATLEKAGKRLLAKINCKIVLITLGENGMAVFQKGKRMKQIPTAAQEVFDVSGAGDTVIASYTLSLASGADPIMAAHISNYAAGIVVGKVGIAMVTSEELLHKIEKDLVS